MSHIHLPDGILPVRIWLAGFLLTALLVGVLWQGGRATARPRRFALLGLFAATMMLVMTIELPPFGYHFNLTVVSGIILGPQLSVLAALIVNTLLALLGHGGITVIGLNTLSISAEMMAGAAVFHLLSRWGAGVRPAGFVAVLCGLATGTGVSFGIISLGRPWIDATLRAATLRPGAELAPGIAGPELDLTRLALLMFGLGAIGWVVEGLFSGAVLVYLRRVYPGLIDDEPARALPGEEA